MTTQESSKAHHRVPVVRITDIAKHPNADSLGLVAIDGYQVVVKLGEFQGRRAAAHAFLWKPKTLSGPGSGASASDNLPAISA